MMTIRDVAGRLKCAASTVYQLVESGKLGVFRIGPNGGGIRVSEEQLNEYLEACRVTPREPEPKRPPRRRLNLTHVRLK